MKRFQIYCISAGRESKLPFSEEELEQIHFITDRPYKVPNNTIGGGLIASRNMALRLAFEQNLNCVQISDDVANIHMVNGSKRGVKVDLLQAIEVLQKTAEKTTANLIGIPPTHNPLFAHPRYVANRFIIGDAFLVKPSNPRFDEKLQLKEDYDFTMQHIHDQGTVRVQTMVWSFRHYSNAGGAVEYRDDMKEQQAIGYLMNKWPGRFRLNTKRKNEILIR